jgi:thiol-disulfide isomerase/thioredoxin
VVTLSALTVLLLGGIVAAQGPGLRLDGLRGGELRQRDLDQGAVIAVVWSSWSPRSRDIVERVNAIVDRWGGEAKVIMVDFQEDPQAVEDFLRGKQPKAPIYLDKDGAFSKKYAITHLPGLLVFKDGATRFSGRLPQDPNSLIAQSLG